MRGDVCQIIEDSDTCLPTTTRFGMEACTNTGPANLALAFSAGNKGGRIFNSQQEAAVLLVPFPTFPLLSSSPQLDFLSMTVSTEMRGVPLAP